MPSFPEGFGRNFKNTILRVLHSGLERASEESAYRSNCPVCQEGILFVSRVPTTQGLLLHRFDRCTRCAQGVIYEDETIAGEALPPLTPDFIEKVYAAVNLATKMSDV